MLKEISQILINKASTVREALKLLDKTAEKILFVVEDANKLVGSLTDGDVRRWILRDGNLDTEVDNVCYKDTFFVHVEYNLDKVKEEMLRKKIAFVPVLNEKKEIIEVLVWNKIFDDNVVRKVKNKLDAEVVIMAGGKGTRLDPFTKILPKPLIPIGEKSILEHIIEYFTEYGNDEFFISVHHKAKIIKSYFEEIQPKYKINYIDEDKPLGTIGALKLLENKFNRDIILTNCDIIIEADYSDLLHHHRERGNDITIVASLKHFNIPYGICEIENGGSLINIREKPEYDLLVNTGMYVLNPKILSYIPQDQLFHITDLIEAVKSYLRIGIYPISEKAWIDVGEWAEYKKALDKLSL